MCSTYCDKQARNYERNEGNRGRWKHKAGNLLEVSEPEDTRDV